MLVLPHGEGRYLYIFSNPSFFTLTQGRKEQNPFIMLNPISLIQIGNHNAYTSFNRVDRTALFILDHLLLEVSSVKFRKDIITEDMGEI